MSSGFSTNAEDEITYEKSDKEKEDNASFLKSITNILKDIIQINKEKKHIYKRKLKIQKSNIFNSKHIPSISIDDYLERIFFNSKIEKSTLINALIYIDRLSFYSNLLITPYNVHKILFSSVLLSIKYNEDKILKFDNYSFISGIDKKVLNDLEYEFITYLQFNLYISDKEYNQYSIYLEKAFSD